MTTVLPYEAPMIRIDYSERDRERRYRILEGVNWNLDKARELLRWVEVGDVVRWSHDP